MSSEIKKVLFAHDGPLFYDPEGNYYGIHLTEKLKQRYRLLGNKVTFVIRTRPLPKDAGNHFSQILNNNFRVVDMPDYKSFTKYFSLRRKAKEIIEKLVIEHDIIIVRLPSGAGAIAVEYAKKHNKPLLAEMVACTWDAYWNYNWKGKLVAPYFYYRLKNRLKNLPYVIYVTRKFLQSRYPTNGFNTNISNVELSEIKEIDLKKRLERIEGWDGQTPLTLLTIAALNVSYKGQDDVIKALYNLKKKGLLFKYRLIGQGSTDRLQNLINKLGLNNEVEIIGPVKHEDVFEEIAQTDIYIQPSKQEGLPRSVIEAMSKACPVIGANTGGIPELISPACIFKKGNKKQIAQLLSKIDKTFLSEMAKINFETAKEYLPELLSERRKEFYQTFINENFQHDTK